MEEIIIIKTYIQKDLRNGAPTVVYLDDNGDEWVHEEQSSQFGGYITKLVNKKESWYWKSKKPKPQ